MIEMANTSKTFKADSVKKNFLFQLFYQVIVLVLPLVTAPYLTRVLGNINLGNYSYTFSIAYYFVVGANLGITRHGQRIISSRRNDEISLRKTFWSLYFVHICLSLLSLLLYFIFVVYQENYQELFIAQGFFVASVLFDLTWLFYGLENFKSVVFKNLFIKIIETVLIFVLVKNTSDTVVYTIIMSASLLIGNMILLPQAIRWIKPIKFSFVDAKEHFKPLLILSITVIAVTLYTMFDKTLLGKYSTQENVAYYEYSSKIINIPKTIITVVGTVLFPRACLCFANNDTEGMKNYFRYSLLFTYFIGFGALFGLLAVADLFAFVYYGEEFIACGEIIKIMAPIILIVTIGDIVRTQFLVPMKKDVLFILILVSNSIINLILTFILIPKIGIYGALVGSIAAESFGTIAEIIVCRKYVDFKVMFFTIIPFLLSGLIMYFTIEFIKLKFNTTLIDVLIQIFSGMLIYVIFTGLYFLFISKDKVVIREKIKKIFNRKNNGL